MEYAPFVVSARAGLTGSLRSERLILVWARYQVGPRLCVSDLGQFGRVCASAVIVSERAQATSGGSNPENSRGHLPCGNSPMTAKRLLRIGE